MIVEEIKVIRIIENSMCTSTLTTSTTKLRHRDYNFEFVDDHGKYEGCREGVDYGKSRKESDARLGFE